MWANAQRDGRRVEYRWRPLFNRKVWLTPATRVPCSSTAKTRNPLKFAGVPQTRQQISAANGPKFTVLWGHGGDIAFPIVDTCRSCEDIARQSYAMVPRWRIFGDFCVLHFQRAACSIFQTCILNSH